MVEASNGRDALRMVEQDDEIDLVVADETAEPYGAFGLARECKLLLDPPAVIVLLERPQDAWLARWSGADKHFVRPIDAFALADAAAALVSPAAARRK
jgi:CheY-like chemotaxis protein